MVTMEAIPMDPLRKVEDARLANRITKGVHSKILARYKIVQTGIARIEKASGLRYPPYYVEPSVILTTSPLEMGQLGVLFARTVPVIGEDNRLRIIVQLTGPLVAFGIKGTLHAILAHEFLHYLELVGRMVKMDTLSDEVSGTLFEGTYSDLTRLFDARRVFNDRSLLRLITKKFPEGFHDERLEEKAVKLWLEKGLPSLKISMEENVIRIPMSVVANTEIDQSLRNKIYELETVKYRGKGKRANV
jgi:hypothetical protein